MERSSACRHRPFWAARLLEAAFGDVDLHELLRPGVTDTASREPVGAPGELDHTQETYSVSLTFDESVDWAAFGIWLSMLLHARGEDMLRVKGFLDVGESGPVVLNGVQHFLRPPQHLDEWPDRNHRSRIVFITKGIQTDELPGSLRAFRNLPRARSMPLRVHS